MRYVSLILEYVFSRTLVRADILSTVAAAFVPGVYFLLGHQVPDNFGVLFSLWFAVTVCIVLSLRFLAAPYVIWRRDQAEISQLRGLLSEPGIRRQQYYQDFFLRERAELAKQINQYAMLQMDHRPFASFDADTHLVSLTSTAAFFLGDIQFRQYWKTFCDGLRNATRGARFAANHQSGISPEHQRDLNCRFAYDFLSMKVASQAMVFILTENHEHQEMYEENMQQLKAAYANVANADASIWTVKP